MTALNWKWFDPAHLESAWSRYHSGLPGLLPANPAFLVQTSARDCTGEGRHQATSAQLDALLQPTSDPVLSFSHIFKNVVVAIPNLVMDDFHILTLYC